MHVSHKLLSTGYHHVRATGYAHLYAQWPIGTLCDTFSVSAGEFPPSLETIDLFVEAANRAAEQHTEPQS